MRSGDHHPLGTSLPAQPRRLGSHINQTFISLAQSASIASASAFVSSVGQHNRHGPLIGCPPHEAEADDDEDLDSQEDFNDGDDEEDEEEEEVEEEELSFDAEDDAEGDHEDADYSTDEEYDEYYDSSFQGQLHHYPPHSHHHHLQQHLQPFPTQLGSYHQLHMVDYTSDDLGDMSDDDAGTPLVSVLEVANLLAHNMGMNDPSETEEDRDLSGQENIEPPPEPGLQEVEIEVDSEGSVQESSDSEVDAPTPITPGQAPAAMIVDYAGIYPNPTIPPPVPNPPVGGPHGEFTVGWSDGVHPVALSNPNPATLGSSNYGLSDFLHHWARQSRMLQGLARGRSPWPAKIDDISCSERTKVSYDDLQGDGCDLQGIDWDELGVGRKDARERRLLTYNNYVNIPDSDRWTPDLPDSILPATDNFFRFRRLDIHRNVNLSHFQLRYLLGVSSRSSIFYPSRLAVHQFNPLSGESRTVVKLNHMPGSQISSLTAGHDVLVAGTFNGEYRIRHLNSCEPESKACCHSGTITTHISGITNHIEVHQARTSSTPLAAFASNDMMFRVLDINTETFVSEEAFEFPLNCTALSPDKRLRVVVGDSTNVTITAAESSLSRDQPEILHELSGHRDYGFACDWADDGWTIATAFQDKSVKIWDARFLTDSSGASAPICTLRTEMAGARNLKFSPIGSGKRVLVAAEEADYINIIDAQTFRTKQTIDIFSEIGGVEFANGGEDLVVLCCDRDRGGILHLERASLGAEAVWETNETLRSQDTRWGIEDTFDWPQSMFTESKRRKETYAQRRRRTTSRLDIMPF
ncbi:WD40-repeat-containing domain protein [Podospora australis]|uniref:WD40-repeat-containing domain protein n=1 Tax=Podospora australis TaxID=1536484 RepID=A0AAN6WYG9_9PEZI|nr:WD40-repeat-containing domain protein [Podospora australis]